MFDAEVSVILLILLTRELLLPIPAGVGLREDDFSASPFELDDLLVNVLRFAKKGVLLGMPVTGRDREVSPSLPSFAVLTANAFRVLKKELLRRVPDGIGTRDCVVLDVDEVNRGPVS